MTHNRITIEDILHDYERIRLRNKRLLQEREEAVFKEIPRIKEICTGSAMSYLKAARERLINGEASDEMVSDIKKENRQKTREKHRLLMEHGYPADYLDPIYDCSECLDTGYRNGAKCSCFTKRIIDSLYLMSNLGNILLKENFDTFSLEYYSDDLIDGKEFSPHVNMENVLEKSRRFAEGFNDKAKNRGNILIFGETGLGKTFLSNCIAKELLDNNHTVLYLSANELFEKVLSGYIMNHREELLTLYDYIFECELLIIDDLGTELTNSFVLTQLFEIINQREGMGLSTLISTNLSMKQLRDRYTERIMSRIIADYTVFNIYGDNIRYQKRKQAINQTS